MFEILLLLGLTAGGLALFERLRLPAIAGFLAAGAIAGPGVLGLFPDSERVRALAEIGVVFLLFEIGLELPLDRLKRLWRSALVAGSTQVIFTVVIVASGARLFGLSWQSAAILGALVAMSSTALVMRLLAGQGQVDSPHGQLTVSILIFQDLSIVPFLLAIPLLASGNTETSLLDLSIAVARLALALAVVFGVVRYLVPRVLARAARARSSDLFSLLSLLVVFGSAFFAQELGLTLAVGAFLAGVAASSSPYAQQLFSEVVPLRGVLLGIFFTAVGMLFDPRVLVEHAPLVFSYLVAALVVKGGLVVLASTFLLGKSLRVGVVAGLTLAQTGEFTFVLAEAARAANLIEEWIHQSVIAGSILSLMATPFLIRVAPMIADWLSGEAESEALQPSGNAGGPEGDQPVIIIGFGPGGQTLARLLRSLGVPYAIIEANSLGVEQALRRGEPITYGDATRPQVLKRIGVASARLVVVAISDPLATRRIVSRIRNLSDHTPILARTRFIGEVDLLEAAGASTVVAEEFEGSLELVARALQLFGIPDASIQKFTEALRDDGYGAIRSDTGLGIDPWLVEILQEVNTQWLDVPSDFAGATSLAELDVRAATGASILAIERAGITTANPAPAFDLMAGDRVLALGDRTTLAKLDELLANHGATR